MIDRARRIRALRNLGIQVRVARSYPPSSLRRNLRNYLRALRLRPPDIEERSLKRLPWNRREADLFAEAIIEPIHLQLRPVAEQTLLHAKIEAPHPLRREIRIPPEE